MSRAEMIGEEKVGCMAGTSKRTQSHFGEKKGILMELLGRTGRSWSEWMGGWRKEDSSSSRCGQECCHRLHQTVPAL